MKPYLTPLLVLLSALAGLVPCHGDGPGAATSHSAALESLRATPTNGLSRAAHRLHLVRLHDALWRAQGDALRDEAAERALKALDTAFPREGPSADHDQAWAEAQESLGDLHRRRGDPWDRLITRYGLALDWWAEQADLGTARTRYLSILWKLERPPGAGPARFLARNELPFGWIQDAVRIARDPADTARARLLRAMALRQAGPPDERALYLVEDDFLAAVRAGKGTDWYDDALFQYAAWLEASGRLELPTTGGWWRGPDAARALEVYRRIVAEFAEGASAYRRPAEERIREILRPEVVAAAGSAFLPGGDVEFSLRWRNEREIRWTLTALDMTTALRIPDAGNVGDWIPSLRPEGGRVVAEGSVATGDDGTHREGVTNIVLRPRPAKGAYLLEARGGRAAGRELVLVSDAALTLRCSGSGALAWFTDAETGRPIPEARVRLWQGWHDGARPHVRALEGTTDASGVAAFELGKTGGQLLVCAASGARQAFAQTWNGARFPAPDGWKFYAVTDRPAYRPGDVAHWKFTARRTASGAYRTPAGENVFYEIRDARGGTLAGGTARLNAFGSAWGDVTLGTNAALGECRVAFWTAADKAVGLGDAALFRVEEYRLPEFLVAVSAGPGPEGARRTYKLGEAVEIVVAAEFFRGGAVPDATAEILVRRLGWSPSFPKDPPYAWYGPEGLETTMFRPGGDGVEVLRRTLRTDAEGRARLVLETDAAGEDCEYRIEARVTDASRREVSGRGAVRVTRARYFAEAVALNRLPATGGTARLEFRTRDADGLPVAVAGTVRVVRRTWTEVWLRPDGREATGAELDRLRRDASTWPPPPDREGRPWRLKSRGYEEEAIASQALATGTNGLAEFAFRPARQGYYSVEWRSPGNATAPAPADNRPHPYEPEVTASASVWVCPAAGGDIGYRRGDGVEIIVDRDAFRAGATAAVMLATDSPGRWILFTVEAGDSLTYRAVHVPGTARLIEWPLDERHMPNVWLAAAGVWGRGLHTDEREVLVPPESRFLSVEVTPDSTANTPRGEGRFVVRTRDHLGRPVPAEVSFGVTDEAVLAIGEDLAGDPRGFFYGTKRPRVGHWSSAFESRPYLRLDVAERERRLAEAAGIGGGAAGGVRDERDVLARAEKLAFYGMQTAAPASRGLLAEGLVADAKADAGTAPGPAVIVRSDFRDTAYWRPDLTTGADGSAEVALRYPDATTRWIATARAATTGDRFGMGTNAVRTVLPLMVRLQTPRFLVAGDVAVVSAVIANNTEAPLRVSPRLDVEGATITGGWADGRMNKSERAAEVTVPAHGEHAEAWTVSVAGPGPVKFTVVARGGALSDAVERVVPAHERGLEQLVAVSGRAAAGDAEATLVLPAARRPGSTRMVVDVAPSLAATMLDALPYLGDYPYGCTEQTLGRFLPAVVVARTLRGLGLDADAAMSGVFGGVGTNTAAPGTPGGRHSPAKLDDMVRAGLDRLADFQHDDGGWGWWKEGASDPWMTAYVVWGLKLAADAGAPVEPARIARGAEWLRLRLAELEGSPADLAWALHALTAVRRSEVSAEISRAFSNLLGRRDDLSAYGRALLTLSLAASGRADDARRVARGLEDGAIRDDASASVLPGGPVGAPVPVVHWGSASGWRRWSEGAVETTAAVVRALIAADPGNALLTPAVTWLQRNRRGARWNNTRDTALVVLALTEYLRATGETRPDLAYAVEVNGHVVGEAATAGRPPWEIRGRFEIDESLVRPTNVVRVLRRSGTSPFWYAARAEFFSLEEPIRPSGNELFVRRDFFRLVPRETLLRGTRLERVPLDDAGSVQPGDRIESVITLEAKNDLEYLLMEDLKPAGFEAVEIRSGGGPAIRALRRPAVAPGPAPGTRDPGDYGDAVGGVHAEWRDRRAAFFVDRLGQGLWELRCEYRAETPGIFHAMPVLAEAMYVPELRANGAGGRLRVGR